MKTILLTGLTLLTCHLATSAFSQDDTSNHAAYYWGGNFGITLYSFDRSGLAIKEFYKVNGEAGFSFLLRAKSKTLKRTGLEVSYKKSPFLNGVSTYESFLDLPFMISFLNIDRSEHERARSINFLIGGKLSLLLEHGTGTKADEIYHLTKNAFGDYLKISLLSEVSYNVFPKKTGKSMQSFGMRFGKDFEDLVVEFDGTTKPVARYLTATLFYSLLFSFKK